MFCRLVLRIQESIKPKTGSVLMTNVAETKGLPHRAMSSLTQALFKQTSTVQQGVCDRTQVWQMAGSPNYVPRRIKKVERAHLFLFEGSKVQHICYKCGPVRMHLSQQRPQGTVSYLYCMCLLCLTSPPSLTVTMVRRDQQSVFFSAYSLSLSRSIWKLSLLLRCSNPYTMAKASLQKGADAVLVGLN